MKNPTRAAFTSQAQGKVVIEQDGDGWLIMTPDGKVAWVATRKKAEQHAKKWFKSNLKGDIGVGSIEWRGSKAQEKGR
jgi:hypothetical protein